MTEQLGVSERISYRSGLALSMSLFFLCGFSTALDVIVAPYLQSIFHLGYTSVALLPVSFYLAYFIFSPFTGYFFQFRPSLQGIRSGLLIGTLGCVSVCLAALGTSYPLILFGIFILGGGIAMIQVTGNPYAMEIGNLESASSRLTLTQAFTSIGTILAPYIGSIYLLSVLNGSNPGHSRHLNQVYLILAIAWAGLLLLSFSRMLPSGRKEIAPESRGSVIHPLKERFVVFGLVAIGLGSGIEVGISTYLVKFISAPDITGISMASAGKLITIIWIEFLIVRLIASRVVRRYRTERMLLWHSAGGAVMSLAVICFTGYPAAAAVLSLGIFLSIMFPFIFSAVLRGCQADKSLVAGFLCMANIGGALMPLLQGVVADTVSLQGSFVVPLVGFLYIAGFSLYLIRRS